LIWGALSGSCTTEFPQLRDGACEVGKKLCAGNCVPADDPAYGCASESCNACSLENGVAKCSGGTCVLASCSDGFENCDDLDSTGCEAKTETDSKNCGTCQRDCRGGECSAGACAPIVVALGQVKCFSVAADATHVYWVNQAGSAGLQRLEHAKVGQTPTVLYAPAAQGDLAIDQTHVYWANETSGLVFRLDKKALGTPQQVGMAVGATGVALDATHVYWTGRGTGGATDGTVSRALKDGSGAQVLASSLDSPMIIALDSTHAYWTSQLGGSVSRVAKAGGAAEVLAVGKGVEPSNGWGVVVTFGNVFWRDGAQLRRVSAAGGTPGDAATDQPASRFLTLQDGHLYWGRGPGVNAAQIMSLSADVSVGTQAEPITAPLAAAAHGIASDADYIYFTNFGSGTTPSGGVFKVARP
ncbi:MAG TPA: hypothetical protein PKA88_25195, partial [Polyangiaceae bacterium]|nr:hypothetical protein [Polyangiaceae bacterium]